MMNNSLTRKEYYDDNGNYFNPKISVSLFNPLSRELNVMRQSLIFGGIESIAYNLNRKLSDLKFYEFGNVYSVKNADENDIKQRFLEKKQLALFITGNNNCETWNIKPEKTDFFYLKNIIENIIINLGLKRKEINIEISDSNLFEEGLVYLLNNNIICEFGLLKKVFLKQFDIKPDVFYGYFEWDAINKLLKNKTTLFEELPKFPEVRRDLALVIDNNINYNDLEKTAYQTEKRLLKNVNLFDVYKGNNIEDGKKSYALSFILQDNDKTMTDKDIDKAMNKILDSFIKNFNAKLR